MFICMDDIVNFVLCTGPVNDDGQPQASKVLMVLAVGITGHWRMPLAYCLTDGADANLQQSLITTVITKLWESSCLSISVTMDGLAANQKTLQLLDCSLDPDHMISMFPHPVDSNIKVTAIFDTCHMLKLARNCLYEYKVLSVPGTGSVKWEHISNLHQKQLNEGLRRTQLSVTQGRRS